MINSKIAAFEKKQINDNINEVVVGSNVKVHVLIKEDKKERIQIFEGLVISLHRSNSPLSSTFTVRKISHGIGVERTFLVNSPLISKIEIVQRNKVRRSKLYYMRDRQGKALRLKKIS